MGGSKDPPCAAQGLDSGPKGSGVHGGAEGRFGARQPEPPPQALRHQPGRSPPRCQLRDGGAVASGVGWRGSDAFASAKQRAPCAQKCRLNRDVTNAPPRLSSAASRTRQAPSDPGARHPTHAAQVTPPSCRRFPDSLGSGLQPGTHVGSCHAARMGPRAKETGKAGGRGASLSGVSEEPGERGRREDVGQRGSNQTFIS